MLTVVVRSGLLPQQIDDFPDGCKRSCKGALHLKPGTLIVTDGELEHIQKSRPELRKYLQLISRPVEPVAPLVIPDESGGDPGGASDDLTDETKGDPAEPETAKENPDPPKTDESKPPKRSKRRGVLPDAH